MSFITVNKYELGILLKVQILQALLTEIPIQKVYGGVQGFALFSRPAQKNTL